LRHYIAPLVATRPAEVISKIVPVSSTAHANELEMTWHRRNRVEPTVAETRKPLYSGVLTVPHPFSERSETGIQRL